MLSVRLSPIVLVLELSAANETGLAAVDHLGLAWSDTVVADALTGFQSNPLTTAGHDQENADVAVQVSQRSAGDGGAGAQTAQTARRCPGGGAKLA
jgi:hypothetical protein